MFSLTTHSAHFIYVYIGIGRIFKGSFRYQERKLLVLPLWTTMISSKGSFICTIPHTGYHTTAFVTPVVEHWLEREIA